MLFAFRQLATAQGFCDAVELPYNAVKANVATTTTTTDQRARIIARLPF